MDMEERLDEKDVGASRTVSRCPAAGMTICPKTALRVWDDVVDGIDVIESILPFLSLLCNSNQDIAVLLPL